MASREAWKDVHERLGALINEHKTTLIFVPSRRHALRFGRKRVEVTVLWLGQASG